ncbi:recombinase family protein [Halorussus salinus]|uniref:recombinase family protein n=1 Tax=Halorussus salinus TaxID=1364935 RepID=UPI00138F1724|nr:recombinase family protein [Halorussus salinus]
MMDEECVGGVIYARVSSNKQAEEGRSLEAQVDQLKKEAERREVGLVRDPIRDEGETGTDFNRSGIRTVFRLAKNGTISHLFVDSIDRLGRSHVQTLYFIHELEVELDVQIITLDGDLDFDSFSGKINTTMQTLFAELDVQKQGSKALRAKARSFLEDKNWDAWYNSVPIGYVLTSRWPTPKEQSRNLARSMYNHFLMTESYAKTTNLLNCTKWKYLESELTEGEVKRCLKNPIYIGQPSIPIERVDGYDHKGWIDEPNLQLVDEDLWEEAQQTIRKISRENSQENSAKDVDDFVDEYGVFIVLETSPVTEIHCPCCRSLMVENGPRSLHDSTDRYLYKCSNKECEQQRVWPREDELDAMKLLELLRSSPEIRDQLLDE